jgi:UDP-N-acetylglucosamine:LPS N-acetylglucosamine transferase
MQKKERKKVIVFAWDIAHNAVGRAFLFVDVLKEKYDVTLIGPKFKHFGDTLWSPLIGKLIYYRGYEGSDFPAFYSQVKKEIKDLQPDFIIACKTRIPSILPALLLKKELGIPVFIDIDDSELSFFKTDKGINFEELIANKTNAEFLKPYSKLWTQYSETNNFKKDTAEL